MGRSVPAWGRAGLTRRDGCRRVAHANAQVRGSLGLAAEPAAPSPPLHPQSPRMICGSDGMLGLRKGFGFAGEGLRLCRCMDRARAAPDAGPLLRTSRGEQGVTPGRWTTVPASLPPRGMAVTPWPEFRRRPVGHQRPDDPRHHVRQGDGDPHARLARQHAGRPRPSCVGIPVRTAASGAAPQIASASAMALFCRFANGFTHAGGIEPRVVTGQAYPACPVTSTGADLHRAHASGRCRDERPPRITPQHRATHGCASRIRAVPLENRLDRIDPAGAHPTRGCRLQGCRNTAALAQRCRRGTSTPTLRVVLRRSPAEMRTHGNDRQ